MRIHFFTKGDRTVGSSRQRAFLMAEELAAIGIDTVVHEVPYRLDSKLPRTELIAQMFRYVMIFTTIRERDIIFLQRTVYNRYRYLLIVLSRLVFRRRIVLDLDDPIYLHSFVRTFILVKLSDAVAVGSHALADWAHKYHRNVQVIPTCVSFRLYEKYNRAKRGANKRFTIGWMGNGPAHRENLRLLRPVFEKLMERGVEFKFVLVGSLGAPEVKSIFQDINGLDVEFIDALDWANPEEMPRTIQNFDVGLMPLIDTEWNRGKCAFKAIEYMACGVPAVVSPVGENNYLVEDGVNGFLAGPTEEWVDRIMRVYDDPDLLKKLGESAQETIKNRYSFQANVPTLKSVLENL